MNHWRVHQKLKLTADLSLSNPSLGVEADIIFADSRSSPLTVTDAMLLFHCVPSCFPLVKATRFHSLNHYISTHDRGTMGAVCFKVL